MAEGATDEIELCQNVGPHALVDSIKSQAVVKFSAVQVPAQFNRLECNTNLNLPPSNWLTTSDSSFGIHQAVYHSSGFTSFRMAHMFPDCVGEVDVVSDAENIKRLLKLPYASKGAVSMIVHKVGNTLLLDEFDVQKYLMRRADDDWKWLRTFILEQIIAYGDKEHNYSIKDKSREAIQTKNLLSKFLYYSLRQSEAPVVVAQTKHPPLPITGPVLPEPKVDENVPDPKSSHDFNRNVVWTFEDIRMLIGTDMPIFGGPNRPCISLRLRDMAKPINVLTGIDYWLDNLMCNVPEVVMCYHIDGIVQKYEIIKTEDLPYLEDSQFSPQVVRNVAQNILSFLKSNATKEGHTYWLFKGRNDDVVKLYDLSTLCENAEPSSPTDSSPATNDEGNPFTVPVAMLLYTVARNMKSSTERISAKTAGNICALLSNCIKLLPREKFPQIVTSSHYILSDLYVPAGIDPRAPNFDTSDTDSDTTSLYGEEEDEDDELPDDDDDEEETDEEDALSKELTQAAAAMHQQMAVKSICATLKEFKTKAAGGGGKPKKQGPTPLHADTEERCRSSLEHISAGLTCLGFYNANEEKFIKESEARAKEEERQRILHEEQNPNMARPFKPIPLPYECLNKQRLDLETIKHNNQAPTLIETEDLSAAEPSKRVSGKRVPLKINEETHLERKQLQQNVAVKFNTQQFGSWNVHLKLLLLEKACLTYATLAEYHYNGQRYGACLKAIYMACRCQQVVLKYMSTIVSQKSCLLGRAGDCLFQMAKNWDNIDEQLQQYEQQIEVEANINAELEKDLTEAETAELLEPEKNLEVLMVSSCKCYDNAINCLPVSNDSKVTTVMVENKTELLRRLGNVCNELGLRYMYWAQEDYTKLIENETEFGDDDERMKKIQTLKADNAILFDELTMKSYDSLMRGIAAFTEVQDNVNLAFLYCNMGRFLRFRAHIVLPDESYTNYIQKQKGFYKEAFRYYERAKDVLKSRKLNAELWDLVNWELSTATFTLAKQLQDSSTTEQVCSIADMEKEVLDLLMKALKLCDVEHPGSRQILYTYRSGIVCKRIASFYYSQLRQRMEETATLPNTTLHLCTVYYERAASILDSLKEANDLLTVHLERISLQEYLAEFHTHPRQKIKHMQNALSICLQSKVCYDYALSASSMETNNNNNNTIIDNKKHNANDNDHDDDNASSCSSSSTVTTSNNEEFLSHTLLLESRIQFALKTLIKLLLNGKDPKKLNDVYRKMYLETLTGKRTTGEQQVAQVNFIAMQMAELLERLQQLAKQIDE